jgi:hypothetical protein
MEGAGETTEAMVEMIEVIDIEMITKINTEINIEGMKTETVEIDTTADAVEAVAGEVEAAVLIPRYYSVYIDACKDVDQALFRGIYHQK